MTAELKQLRDLAQKNAEQVAGLTKTVEGLTKALEKTRADGHPGRSEVFGVPWARNGEDPMSSRGFSFMKMIGLLTGACTPERAKVEMDVHRRMHQCLVGERAGTDAYVYAGNTGQPGMPGGKFLAPLATGFLHDEFVDRSFRREMKSLVAAGTDGADMDEAVWIRRKMLESMGYGRKDLSWLNETLGGALVAPPEMGELIELLRNKEAMVNAGARVVPLPPQGRMKYPRQTGPSTTYWVGENTRIQDSNVRVGEVTLQAKKLAVLIKAPNELIRFASPAAEALLRDDMTKSLALGLDLAALEGTGGDTQPLGIINFQNINRISSSKPAAAGDALVAEDIYRMVAAVQESNAEFEGWIMRPKTWLKYLQLRADAVSQGDRQGMFLFNAIREQQWDGGKPALAGYPVTTSTQVSQVRSNGTGGTNLTYILAGMFSDVLLGMFGAIEFAATTLGDTTFQFDQTWIRGILSADVQLRHESAFVLVDNLNVGAGS